jgi:hypothetical protein
MNSASSIAYARVPASHGFVWLREAYELFRDHPLRWLALLVAYYAIAGVLDFLPWIGFFAHLVLKPVFTVGFVAATWSVERGGAPELAHLFRGFRSDLSSLLGIGAVLVAGIVGAAIASMVVDGGELAALMRAPGPVDRDAFDTPGIKIGLLAASFVLVPLLLATWFAPALVVFQDCGARKAIATSFAAALANWRAIAVYVAFVAFYAAILPTLALAVIAMIVPEPAQGVLMVVLVLPWYMCLFAVLQIAEYIGYRDVFHPDGTADTGGPSPSDDGGPSP